VHVFFSSKWPDTLGPTQPPVWIQGLVTRDMEVIVSIPLTCLECMELCLHSMFLLSMAVNWAEWPP
jgi:hypothetical protein